MSQDLNIDQILAEEGERYLPLFQYILKRSNPEFVLPADIDGRIKRQIAARNLFLFDELHRILEIFNNEGIDNIILKGAALAEGLYPHLGLRPFTDIDILIHRERLPQVIKILSRLGYSSHSHQLRPGAEDFQGEVNYVKEGEIPIMIEPHWTLGSPYPYPSRLDMQGLWERAERAKIAGINTLVLSPEDLLLHLCLHVLQHHRGGWLTSACDIAELVCQKDIDWEAFLSRVFEFKLSLPVQYALEKTCKLFNAHIPAFVLEQLKTFKVSSFEKRIFILFTGKGRRGIFARLLTMPGIGLKLRYVQTFLFPSKDFMLNKYAIKSSKLLPFYYLRRLSEGILLAFNALFHFVFYKGNPSLIL